MPLLLFLMCSNDFLQLNQLFYFFVADEVVVSDGCADFREFNVCGVSISEFGTCNESTHLVVVQPDKTSRNNTLSVSFFSDNFSDITNSLLVVCS